MPENEFEKQVQQLFEEFKLKPSAEVWPRVSSGIQTKRRRRPFLLWIPFMVLVLGSGGYWLLQHNSASPASRDNDITQIKPGNTNETGLPALEKTTPTSENNGTTNKEGQENDNTTKTQDIAASGKNIFSGGLGSGSSASNQEDISLKPPVNLQASGRKQQGGAPSVRLPVPEQTGRSIVAGVTPDDLTPDAAEPKNNVNSGALASGLPPAQRQVVTPRNNALSAVETPGRLHPLKDARPLNAQVKLVPKQLWEWGITGSAGISASGESLSELLGAGQTEKSAMNRVPGDLNFSANLGFITGQNSLVAAMPAPASSVKKGMGLQLGGFLKRKLSPGIALTSGLNYTYFSTNRLVGANILSYQLQLDNTREGVVANYSGYYPGYDRVNYTSRYHFVELPIGIQWQLNPSAKLPVTVNGGLSISYLVNTNALHYHSQTGSYYKDNSLFNKTQAGAFAGAAVQLFHQSRSPLYIGPVVQYNLSRLLKPAANLNQHLVYAGLKAGWVLGKK